MTIRSSGELSPRARVLVRVVALAAAAGFTGAGLYVLAVYPPTPTSYYPGCQFHALTGLHCPGCGTTRALHAALNGRLAQAAAYNPFVLVLVPLLGWWVGRSLWAWWRGRAFPPPGRWAERGIWVLAAALLAFGVLRNVPAWPFTLLAPHEL